MKFRTTAAYISGGICGSMWWPVGELAGKPVKANLRGPWGLMDRFGEPCSFEDALSSYLCENGGDFQGAEFTADTVIRIERWHVEAPGKYRVHVKEIELSKLVPDLVNADAYVGDFMEDE